MINFLHKKIALVFVLFVQIIKPMEPSPLPVSKICEQSFTAESLFAVMSIVKHIITSDTTMPRRSCEKELSRYDEIKITNSICAGFIPAIIFDLKSTTDNFNNFIATCGHDSQELAFAKGIVWWSLVVSLVQETAFIHRKAVINQMREDHQSPGKVTWHALAKQVGLSDLLTYAFGFYLLMMFPTS